MTERTEGKESRVEGLPVEPGRRGIALVIVLGLLSVMMIMGVAFSISMRTERTAAGHQMEVVKARQLVYGALAHALWDIEDDLERNTNAVYPRHWAREPMPTWFSNAVDLYAGDAVRLLPRGLLETCGQLASPGSNSWVGGDKIWDRNAFWRDDDLYGEGAVVEGPDAGGVVQRGNVLNNTLRTIDADVGSWGRRWYRIVDPAVPQWTPVKDVGRYAYLVVNLSGLLDANRVGGDPRGIGATPREITVNNPPLSDIVNGAQFTGLRDAFSGDYETIAEMLENNAHIKSDQGNFHTYSRFEHFCSDGTNVNRDVLSLDGTAVDLAARAAQIRAKLRDAGLSSSEANDARRNVIDFADADRLPGNEAGTRPVNNKGPYVEAFPMFNEVWCDRARVSITPTGGVYSCRVRYRMKFEVMYPFVAPALPPNRYEFSYVLTPGPNNAFVPNTWSNADSFEVNTIPPDRHYGKTESIPQTPAFNTALAGNTPYGVDLSVDMWIRDKLEGEIVDALRVPLALALEVTTGPLSGSETHDTEGGRECLDPRRNHDPSVNSWPVTTTDTIGDLNAVTAQYFTNNPACDGDFWMYVKDAPFESVGELGAIYFDRPWETVRLYDHDVAGGELHRVLDTFTMAADTNTPFRGRVNLNTEVTQALESVYWDMPLREYTNTPLFAAADVAGVVDLIMNSGFTNRSDMGRIDWANVFNWAALRSALAGLDPAEITELDREAIIRNSCELMGVRQNLFAILLAAQTALTPEEYGPIRAEQQALAIVWRDPYPDASGRHPCFVRWFTWLGQ
jgi:hypothetical protein